MLMRSGLKMSSPCLSFAFIQEGAGVALKVKLSVKSIRSLGI